MISGGHDVIVVEIFAVGTTIDKKHSYSADAEVLKSGAEEVPGQPGTSQVEFSVDESMTTGNTNI